MVGIVGASDNVTSNVHRMIHHWPAAGARCHIASQRHQTAHVSNRLDGDRAPLNANDWTGTDTGLVPGGYGHLHDFAGLQCGWLQAQPGGP